MIDINKKVVKGSIVLLIAFGIFNFFHFLFQFFMARILSVSEYGILAALFALTYIMQILSETVQTVITKYSSGENSNGKLKNILKKTLSKAAKVSFIIFFLFLLISIPLSYFLKINYLLLSLTGIIIFTSFFIPINRGIMQGTKKFTSLGLNMIVEASGKLIIGVLLVYLGFQVYGAIIGVLLGGFLSFLFAFVQLKPIVRAEEEKAATHGIYNYVRPTLMITAIIIIFYSLDVIIAKIVFPPETAGIYAIASILGKIIFWGTLPISKAMFPISAEDSEDKKKEHSKNIFSNAFVLVLLGIISALVLFYFIPELIIKIFSGKIMPEAERILFFVGIAFGLTAVTNLSLLHKLSIGRFKNYYYLPIFIVIEIILLFWFSSNIFEFSIAFITASAIFLWGSNVLIKE